MSKMFNISNSYYFVNMTMTMTMTMMTIKVFTYSI